MNTELATPSILSEDLESTVLEASLAGASSARQIARSLGWPPDDPRIAAVDHLLAQGRFQKKLVDARRDITGSVIDRFKRKLHRVAEEMEKLALEQTTDTRIKFQACKDILDRAGTAPAQKVAVNSPRAYQEMIRELLEDTPDAPA